MTATVGISQSQKNMNEVDMLPLEHRRIVHEFGYSIYRALLRAGVRNPGAMRNLVNEIWHGARGSTRMGKPVGVRGSANIASLDWLLIQSGSNVSAATLLGHMRQAGLVIVPLEPMRQMIDASMETVSGHNVLVSKEEKHRRRLRAAIEAGVDALWPFLRKSG